MDKSYDAVLLDLSLPDMDGPALYDGIIELCLARQIARLDQAA